MIVGIRQVHDTCKIILAICEEASLKLSPNYRNKIHNNSLNCLVFCIYLRCLLERNENHLCRPMFNDRQFTKSTHNMTDSCLWDSMYMHSKEMHSIYPHLNIALLAWVVNSGRGRDQQDGHTATRSACIFCWLPLQVPTNITNSHNRSANWSRVG